MNLLHEKLIKLSKWRIELKEKHKNKALNENNVCVRNFIETTATAITVYYTRTLLSS